MGNYDSIQIPVTNNPISSTMFGGKVRDAIINLDLRVSAFDTTGNTGKAYSTSQLVIATTTETASLTITGMVFRAGIAYQASFRAGVVVATSGTLAQFRVRKYNATPSSGTDWGEYFRTAGTGANAMNAQGATYLINNTTSDITSDVNLDVVSSASGAAALTVHATASSPRFFVIAPCGFATDYVGMAVQVS